MGKEFSDKHDSSRVNTLSTFCSAFNIIYIMRTIIAKGEKQPRNAACLFLLMMLSVT